MGRAICAFRKTNPPPQERKHGFRCRNLEAAAGVYPKIVYLGLTA